MLRTLGMKGLGDDKAPAKRGKAARLLIPPGHCGWPPASSPSVAGGRLKCLTHHAKADLTPVSAARIWRRSGMGEV